jgi:hypothetical protein
MEDKPTDLPETGPDKALFLAAWGLNPGVRGRVLPLEGLVAAYGIQVRHSFPQRGRGDPGMAR